MLREVAIVFSKLLSIILLRGTRESHEKYRHEMSVYVLRFENGIPPHPPRRI